VRVGTGTIEADKTGQGDAWTRRTWLSHVEKWHMTKGELSFEIAQIQWS